MKTSQATIALCLCLTAFAPASFAQPPPASTDAVELEVLTEKARQHFFEGVDAMKKGQWVEAHAAFLAAWRIRPHHSVASNLGASEIKLGRYRDAAEHLSYYLREAPTTKEKERQRAQAMLGEALTKVASVTLRGLPDGAEVKVDGAPLGRAPLPGPVFLDPGAHTFEGKMDGFPTASASLELRPGEARDVTLVLKKAAPPPPPVPIVPPRRSVVPGAVLGGVAGAALVTGIGLFAAGRSKGARGADERDAILGAGHSCVTGASNYDARCADVESTATTANTFQKVGVGLMVGAGVAAAGTVLYFVLPAPAATAKSSAVRVSPALSTNSGGLFFSGAF